MENLKIQPFDQTLIRGGGGLEAWLSAWNEAAPLSRSGSWVLHDLLTILLVFTLRFPSL
jgi:hypothetical protein